MSTDFRPLSLRLPVHLHARVRETALANGRSLNSEIIALLEQAMSEPDRQEQMVKDMERDLKPVFEDMISDVVALANRSEEHTSELQSLMRISYAVFCLKKKKTTEQIKYTIQKKERTY